MTAEYGVHMYVVRTLVEVLRFNWLIVLFILHHAKQKSLKLQQKLKLLRRNGAKNHESRYVKIQMQK